MLCSAATVGYHNLLNYVHCPQAEYRILAVCNVSNGLQFHESLGHVKQLTTPPDVLQQLCYRHSHSGPATSDTAAVSQVTLFLMYHMRHMLLICLSSCRGRGLKAE